MGNSVAFPRWVTETQILWAWPIPSNICIGRKLELETRAKHPTQVLSQNKTIWTPAKFRRLPSQSIDVFTYFVDLVIVLWFFCENLKIYPNIYKMIYLEGMHYPALTNLQNDWTCTGWRQKQTNKNSQALWSGLHEEFCIIGILLCMHMINAGWK